MPLKEGVPSSAIILEIHPLHELGGQGSKPIGFIKHDDDGHIGWYPLPKELIFGTGQRVTVTPETTPVGNKGGAHTIYIITSK